MMETNSTSSVNTSDLPGNVPVINVTTQLTSLKHSISIWEDFVAKSSKLCSALRTVIQCNASFLDALKKIADIACNSNCGLLELGNSMSDFCLQGQAIEAKLKNFNNQLTDCLAAPLALRLEEWRRATSKINRENVKELSRARNDFVRATGEVEKLQKRFRRKLSNTTAMTTKNGLEDTLTSETGDNMQLKFVKDEFSRNRDLLANMEKRNLRMTIVEGRRRFAELMTCLKPVLDCQTFLFSNTLPLLESISQVTRNAVFDSSKLPAETEKIINVSVKHQLAYLTSQAFGGGSVGDARLHGSGIRSMRLLKNSSSRLGLAHTTSGKIGSSTSLPAARTPLSAWAALAATVVTQAVDESRQLAARRSGLVASTSPSPMANGRGDHEDPGGSPASPTHLNAATKTGCKPCQGDALSLFEQPQSADATGTTPRRLQSGNLDLVDGSRLPAPPTADHSDQLSLADHHSSDIRDQTVDRPSAYSSLDPTTTSGSQQQQHQRGSSLLRESTHVKNPGRTATGKQQFTDKEEKDDDEDEDRPVHGSGTDSADDHLSDDRLSRDDDGADSCGSTGQLPQMFCLYPNQLLPAPVYTNLSELKRAAARKFSGSHADVSRPISKLGLAEGSRAVSSVAAADTTSLHGGLVSRWGQDGSPVGSDLGRRINSSIMDDYTDNNQSGAGTSTFGRRQSQYPRIGVNAATAAARCAGGAGGLHDKVGVDYPTGKIYASVTPGLVRRSGNYATVNDNCTSTNAGSSRPVDPPRRSSSLCRDLTDSRQPTPPQPLLPIGLLAHGDYPNPNNGFVPHAFYPGGVSGVPQPGEGNLLLRTHLHHHYQFQQAQQHHHHQRQQPEFEDHLFVVSGKYEESSATAEREWFFQQQQQQLQPTYAYAVTSDVTSSPAFCLPPLASAGHVTVSGSGGTGLVSQVSRPNSGSALVFMPSEATTTVGSRLPIQQQNHQQQRAAAIARQAAIANEAAGRFSRGQVANFSYPLVSDAVDKVNGDSSSAAPAGGKQRQSRSGAGPNRGGRVTSFID